MAETLFVSDLHLEAKHRPMTDLFLRFLRERASGADALYILGDLFESWIGDAAADEHDREVQQGLKALAGSGVPIHLLTGNRDFLLGKDFALASGVRLIADPTRVDLYGTPTLLMHGDSLCTDDAGHMAFRHLARSQIWQQAFLNRPMEERKRIAWDLRQESEALKQEKPREIMDVNPEAVCTTYRTAKVCHIIHGHTHREAIHEVNVDDRDCRRYVLGDWTEKRGSVLQVKPDAWCLQAFN